MKGATVTAISLLVVCVSFNMTLAVTSRGNICEKDVGFGNLMFRFANKGNTPSFQYWYEDGDIKSEKYIISFDRVYAFHNDGDEFKFTKQQLSSWDWELENCTIYCDLVVEDSEEHNMCEFSFVGSNGEPMDSDNYMGMTIFTQVYDEDGIDQFKFGVDVYGRELEHVLRNFHTFQVGFKFIATGDEYEMVEFDNEEGAEVVVDSSVSEFEIRHNIVSLFGATKPSCLFQQGEDNEDEYCGLHNFYLNLDAEKKARLSVSWYDAAGYERLFFDPVVRVRPVQNAEPAQEETEESGDLVVTPPTYDPISPVDEDEVGEVDEESSSASTLSVSIASLFLVAYFTAM